MNSVSILRVVYKKDKYFKEANKVFSIWLEYKNLSNFVLLSLPLSVAKLSMRTNRWSYLIYKAWINTRFRKASHLGYGAS